MVMFMKPSPSTIFPDTKLSFLNSMVVLLFLIENSRTNYTVVSIPDSFYLNVGRIQARVEACIAFSCADAIFHPILFQAAEGLKDSSMLKCTNQQQFPCMPSAGKVDHLFLISFVFLESSFIFSLLSASFKE